MADFPLIETSFIYFHIILLTSQSRNLLKLFLASRVKRSLLPESPQLTWMHARSVIKFVRLFVTPWIVAHQVPLSMGFVRQEYWSGLPFPPPRDPPTQGLVGDWIPNPGTEPLPWLLHWQADSLPWSHLGSPSPQLTPGVFALAQE